jgi:pyruvate dehydrogenase E2 component (dihydrolipoamide acetyltransferase)
VDILMPALSPTMEEGTLAKWMVKAGDRVRSGDVIAEIETDKATMEVEAVDEGVVEAILVPEGTENVKVNAPIARLKGEGDSPRPPPPNPSPLVGEGGRAEPGRMRGRAELAGEPQADKPKGEDGQSGAAPHPSAPQTPSPTRGEGTRLFASPLARRLAQQAGIDLATIHCSGPHGRIIKRDLDGAKAAPAAAKPVEAPRQVQSLEQMGIAAGSYDLVPLDGMKKTVARRMTDSFRDVPHFPLTIDVEIDRLLEARGKVNALIKDEGVRVSVNDIIIKAASLALRRVPEANASYTPEGIALHHHADVAMAVAIDGGLITPIVRAAETKGLARIAAETKDLAARARSRKLRPEEFQGGTFTVSNLGMFGVKSFASIINEPQGAIMSVGVGEKRPIVRGSEIAIATVMTVTLTCDHRVVDGAIGARFLAAFKSMIEDPLTMLV